jgi:hypothetical protein
MPPTYRHPAVLHHNKKGIFFLSFLAFFLIPCKKNMGEKEKGKRKKRSA